MHGHSVRFYCNRGYHRVGASSITCNDGKWDKPLPQCKGENYTSETNFHKFQSTANYWWKFYSDRTRKKTLVRRLKNVSMASEKLYRNTLNTSII